LKIEVSDRHNAGQPEDGLGVSDAMSWIDSLCEQVSRFDREFTASLVPADAGKLQELKDALGVPLPRSYLQFLERMGQDDGGLLHRHRMVSRLDDDLLEMLHRPDRRPEILPIAWGVEAEGLGLYLKVDGCSGPVTWNEPAVVHFAAGDGWAFRGGFLAESLPAYLFETAFFWELRDGLSEVGLDAAPGLSGPELMIALGSRGFTPQWFNGECSRFGGALVYVMCNGGQLGKTKPQVFIGGPSREAIQQACAAMSELVLADAARLPWPPKGPESDWNYSRLAVARKQRRGWK
jgi:hypothetical protein